MEDVDQILSIIPEPWRTRIVLALAFAGALSVALAPAKAIAVRVTPISWRPWVDAVFRVLDLIAVNTRGIHTMPTKPEKKP